MHKKILLASILGFLLATCLPLPAQFPTVGVSGEIPLGRLDEMEQMLTLADAHEKASFLSRLGIDSDCADHVAETHRCGAIHQRECRMGSPEVLPDKLQHQQLVEICIQKRSRNRIQLPVMIVRAPGNINNHNKTLSQ